MRASIILAGPMLARFGKVALPQPGGCLIGSRPIDTHLDAFTQLGVEIERGKKELKFEKEKLERKMKHQTIEIATAMTEKVLQEALSSKDHSSIIDEKIKKIAKLSR